VFPESQTLTQFIPVVVDLTALYPESMVPDISKRLIAYAQENYKDFMLTPPPGAESPAWFVLFMWMELFFHIPVSFWSVRGLVQGVCFAPTFKFTLSRHFTLLYYTIPDIYLLIFPFTFTLSSISLRVQGSRRLETGDP
jgi:EXPERA (EXPanded EBP superfamily)